MPKHIYTDAHKQFVIKDARHRHDILGESWASIARLHKISQYTLCNWCGNLNYNKNHSDPSSKLIRARRAPPQ